MKFSLLPCFLFLFSISLFAQSDLENFLQATMQSKHIPGLATVIVKDGGVCYEGYFGTADFEQNLEVSSSTIFMLASVSKTVTGTALIKLHEDGHFALEDDINDYLPINVQHPDFPNTPITFEMLLSHTASIRDNWDLMPYYPGDYPEPLAVFLYNYLDPQGANYDPNLNFGNPEPGTVQSYSNIGYALIGYLVQVISGQTFDAYCKEHIFGPLQMNSTNWFLADTDLEQLAMPYYYQNNTSEYVAYGHYGYPDYPDGQLRASALDMANFLIAYSQGGQFTDNTTLMESETLELMTPSDFSPGLTWWGEDYNLGNYSIWGHDGGDQGVTTAAGFNPQDGIGVVILTNGEASLFSNDIWEEVWNFARDEACQPYDFPTSVSSTSDYRLQLMPNPSAGSVHLSLYGEWEVLTVRKVDGQVYKQWDVHQKQDLFVENLPSGIYWVEVLNKNDRAVQKLVVSK